MNTPGFFECEVVAGDPPYSFAALPSPPNPPGFNPAITDLGGGRFRVDVPDGYSPGTVMHFVAGDSGGNTAGLAVTSD